MIRSVRATAGYAAQLASLKDRVFDFGPGLTMLFGPNGSGKSTLLKLMAAYSACAQPGWSTYTSEYQSVGYDRKKREDFPQRFARGGRLAGSKADVDWDGTPTFYSLGLPGMGQVAFEDAMERGGDEADDYLRRLLRPGSAGEEAIQSLHHLPHRHTAEPGPGRVVFRLRVRLDVYHRRQQHVERRHPRLRRLHRDLATLRTRDPPAR